MKMTLRRLNSFLSNGSDFSSIDFIPILSNFHEGVVITDKCGTILYYNSTMGEIDDVAPHSAIGSKITEFYDLSDQQSTTMRCLKQQKALLNTPLFYQTNLGKVTNAISSAYPLFSGSELIGAITFTKDYHMVKKVISSKHSSQKSNQPERGNGTRFSFSDIIGKHTDLAESVRIAQMAADSPSPVLISGETGTGKELFAQSIHNFSNSSDSHFVPINCAAIPENLLEGILFGTSKGAFTGAIDKAGLFEQANGGTLFLDELNSMPISLQTKLLRVIQEKKVRRIGSHKEIPLNLKIISSVNQDPHKEINNGHLRLDLFYRLGVVTLQVPPLRERKNDIDILVQHFIDKFNTRLKKNVSSVSADVQHLFYSYGWPGNVRELEHVIEGSMNLLGANAVIEKHNLPQYLLQSLHSQHDTTAKDTSLPPPTGMPNESDIQTSLTNLLREHSSDKKVSLKTVGELHQKIEKQIIEKALAATKGNIAKAMRILELSSPQALQYKMKKLNILRSSFL